MAGENRVDQPTILVTARNVDPLAIEYLVDHGCKVRHPALKGRDPAPETLPALLADVDGWIVGGTNVGHDLIKVHPRHCQVVKGRSAAAAAALISY